MNYDHNKNVGLFKFQSGYRKLYLNSPKGYSRKITNAQTGVGITEVVILFEALGEVNTNFTYPDPHVPSKL